MSKNKKIKTVEIQVNKDNNFSLNLKLTSIEVGYWLNYLSEEPEGLCQLCQNVTSNKCKLCIYDQEFLNKFLDWEGKE